MKYENLSEEELAAVLKLRESKSKEELQRIAAEEKKKRAESLEEEFDKTLKEFIMSDEDDGTEYTLEDSFRKEYLSTVAEAKAKIDVHLANAMRELSEAENISEQYGVPFYAEISPLSQAYRPISMNEKWGEDKVEALQEYAYNVYDEDLLFPEHEGWQHSSVC